MATFTLVTSRRSRRPNRGYSRSQVRPQQTMPTTRDEFRRQFPTHHDAENHYAGTAAAASPQGSWGRKLRVNTNSPRDCSVRRPQKSTSHRVSPVPQVNQRACAYCKEDGHHIRHCEKAAAATAKKQEWKRQEKARRTEEKFNLAEERLRKQILAAQEAKLLEQQPVVEEESDSSDSDYEEEEVSVTVNNDEKIAGILAKIAELRKSAHGASWADAADIDDEIDDLEEELEKLGHTA